MFFSKISKFITSTLKKCTLINKIITMKKLDKQLKGLKYICFLDFEGAQFSHEMIAFGAVFAYLDKKNQIKKHKEPIRFIVKSKNKVGKFVENLTGITDYDLEKRGISFADALKQIKSYCGLYFGKTLFMTFGNHDMKILNSSCSYNFDLPKEIVSTIHKNYMDYQAFISEYIKDANNNPYSLENYLDVFHIKFEGTAHDPAYDALNLMYLYDAFLKNKDIVIEEYQKVLGKLHHLPGPVKQAITKLSEGKDVTYVEFLESIREDLK